MHYRIEYDGDTQNFCECVDDLSDDTIESVVYEYFHEDVCEATMDCDAQPIGYFPNMRVVDSDICEEAGMRLTQKYSGASLGLITFDDKGLEVSRQTVGILPMFLDQLEEVSSCGEFGSQEGAAILADLEAFIVIGAWQYGLQKLDGTITTDAKFWPAPRLDEGRTIGVNGEDVLMPILWFGLMSEQPVACWTICGNQGITPYWKSFWFEGDPVWNWEILLNDSDSIVYIWMFAECGMDEPPIEPVLENCPIELNQDDSNTELLAKIDAFFSSCYEKAHRIC